MADVMVVAVLVLTFEEFPGGTTIAAELGYFVFFVSVLSAMMAVIFAKGYFALRAVDDSQANNEQVHRSEHQVPALRWLDHYEPPAIDSNARLVGSWQGPLLMAVRFASQEVRERFASDQLFREKLKSMSVSFVLGSDEQDPVCSQDLLDINADWLDAEASARNSAIAAYEIEEREQALSDLDLELARCCETAIRRAEQTPLFHGVAQRRSTIDLLVSDAQNKHTEISQRFANSTDAAASLLRVTHRGEFPELHVPEPTNCPNVSVWWLALGGMLLVAGATLRFVSAFGAGRVRFFPTPSSFLVDGRIQLWEFNAGPTDWASVAGTTGFLLIVVSVGFFAIDVLIRWMSTKRFISFVRQSCDDICQTWNRAAVTYRDDH